MYVKVPDDLREPLLKELRQLRLRSAFKHFPALVIIFSSILVLAVFVKGHAIIQILRNSIPAGLSDKSLMIGGVLFIVTATAAILVFFLRQEYRECNCQGCSYCPKCNAVDRYDSGCPICQVQL